MKRPILAVAILVLAGLPVASAVAAPIRDATYVSESVAAPFVTISAPSCSGFPGVDTSPPQTANPLTAAIRGWYGPNIYDENDFAVAQQVQLGAVVSGTVTDANGNIYRASGHFQDNSTHDIFHLSDVAFNGSGTLALTGPAGTIVGDATLEYIFDPPISFIISFTNVHVCNVTG